MDPWEEYKKERAEEKRKKEEEHRFFNDKDGLVVLKNLLKKREEGKFLFRYDMDRRYTIIHVLDAETKKEQWCYCFSYGLGWMHDVIFNFWGEKCACCGINDEDAKKKYGRYLELHHCTPISFNNAEEIRNKSPLEMFEPRCHGCHERGLQ